MVSNRRKTALFRSLLEGRTDVYTIRLTSSKTG